MSAGAIHIKRKEFTSRRPQHTTPRKSAQAAQQDMDQKSYKTQPTWANARRSLNKTSRRTPRPKPKAKWAKGGSANLLQWGRPTCYSGHSGPDFSGGSPPTPGGRFHLQLMPPTSGTASGNRLTKAINKGAHPPSQHTPHKEHSLLSSH